MIIWILNWAADLQISHEWPAADKALVEESQYGRTLEGRFPQSTPGPSATLVVQRTPKQDVVNQTILLFGNLKCICEVVIHNLQCSKGFQLY